jgi:phage terminase large subunit-like protein
LTKSPPVALLEGQAPPRVSHYPKRTAGNDWELVADLSREFGITLDEWQEAVLQAAMGVRGDGRWASPQVAVSAPRQNGKSQLIVARALAGVLLFDEKTIIVSAHQQDTAREVFTKLVDIIETNPALEARVADKGIMRALNRESIRFRGGQVIRFKARSTGGGRGFSCDCLLLDEAQILGAPAWAAIRPTMSARPNPQVWLLGTPPTPQDDGEVFGRFRSTGLEGKQARLAYLEWSAGPGDDLDDPETWARANPAFGDRISHDAIADERATMSDAQFALERLGMWDEALTHAVIDPASWAAVADESSVAVDRLALAVDVSPDRSVASIALAGQSRRSSLARSPSGAPSHRRSLDHPAPRLSSSASSIPPLNAMRRGWPASRTTRRRYEGSGWDQHPGRCPSWTSSRSASTGSAGPRVLMTSASGRTSTTRTASTSTRAWPTSTR